VPTRTIYLGRTDYLGEEEGDPGVDHVFAGRFIKNLHILESLSSEPILIYLNSPGGDEFQGLGIYDAIRSAKSHITINVIGEACSMGSYILQSADERVMSKSSVFMIHQGSDNGYGLSHKRSAKNWMDFNQKYNLDMDMILLDRIREKHPDFKKKKFDEMMQFDTIFTAEETVSLGLADRVEY
jgi:ATP-dependent Clp protease protease subunit